jgi:rare lipoprotein A
VGCVFRSAALVALALGWGTGCYRAARPEARELAQLGPLVGEGLASYYGSELQGHRTANGEIFDKQKLTAAHRTLQFGTCLTVLNLKNLKRVNVRVNDRGPFAGHRIIDVSEAAAGQLGMISSGVVTVRLYRCEQ